jgi:hypothetical protein
VYCIAKAYGATAGLSIRHLAYELVITTSTVYIYIYGLLRDVVGPDRGMFAVNQYVMSML